MDTLDSITFVQCYFFILSAKLTYTVIEWKTPVLLESLTLSALILYFCVCLGKNALDRYLAERAKNKNWHKQAALWLLTLDVVRIIRVLIVICSVILASELTIVLFLDTANPLFFIFYAVIIVIAISAWTLKSRLVALQPLEEVVVR